MSIRKFRQSTSRLKWLLSTTLIFTSVTISNFVPSSASAAQDCGRLANLKIENTNLLSATEVAAGDELPAYCRVLGFVRPAINFEIRLPLAGWNGKFFMAGCGGLCGTLDTDRFGFLNSINFGLRRNYAVSTMDAGHWGASTRDARWAMNNPVALMDFGQRAVTETARVTKQVIRAYYGTEQKKAYFAGCSTGGRMAAMEAWRFPSDFDGIISGAPSLDYTGLSATFFGWVTKANTGADGKPIFPQSKVKLVQDAVVAACGAADGVKDALVSDPRQCKFKPATLICSANNSLDCLTAAEAGVLEKWYNGPINSRGNKLYPGGIPRGSEANWAVWLTGRGNVPPQMPLGFQEFTRYMAFTPAAGPTFDPADFDFDKDPARLSATSQVINAATFDLAKPGEIGADLSAFQQRGGKLILWHGWGDPMVPPQATVEYYEAVANKAGGFAKAQDFARLFMVPGMDHCGINKDGPGISDTGIDPLTALEHWVEEGNAPDELLATKTGVGGATLWQRPICAYPKVARYKGSGDTTDRTSFICAGP